MVYRVVLFLLIILSNNGCLFAYAGSLPTESADIVQIDDVTQKNRFEPTVEDEVRATYQNLYKRLVDEKCPELTQEIYPELYVQVKDLSKRAGIAIPHVFIIKRNSMHSAILFADIGFNIECNAVAYALDDKLQMVLVDEQLLNRLTPVEFAGIIAHELSHIVYKHTQKTIKARVVTGTIDAVVPLILIIPRYLPKEMMDEQKWRITKYCFVVSGGLILGSALAYKWLMRRFEKQADNLATQLVYEKTWVNGLKKLGIMYAERHPFSIKVSNIWAPFIWPFETHPSDEQRKVAVGRIVLDAAR